MSRQVSVRELHAISDDPDLALVDVREVAEYNLAHIPGAWSLPRRQIEYRMRDLDPWSGTRVVVADDDGPRAGHDAATLAAMGYGAVAALTGGTNRWMTEGLGTEWGVNVPSKDFGEKVLLRQQVPELDPDELHASLQRGEKLIMLDSRTPEEHRRACFPGSRSMPGAELGLRAWDLAAAAPDARIVVHCAGRTRSIIGAGTLRRLGFENVYALKNGTMGWQLAGLELETGSSRLELPPPSPQARARAESEARRVAREEGVRFAGVAQAQAIMARASKENVYCIDVRTREEFEAGHVPLFRWVPGGQAVQATDSHVGVRGGTLLFACDGVVRAAMTGAWFRQMGFASVYVLEGGSGAWRAAGRPLATGRGETQPFGLDRAKAEARFVTAKELHPRLGGPAPPLVIFVGTSEEFAEGHLPGSRWLPRGWLELTVEDVIPDRRRQVVVTSPADAESAFAAAALHGLGYASVAVLDGGTAAWSRAGLPLEGGLAGVTRAPDDVLPARRSYAEMLNYLRWEEALGEKYRPA